MTDPVSVREVPRRQRYWDSGAHRRSHAAGRLPPEAGEAVTAAAIALIEAAGQIQREVAHLLRDLAARDGNEVLLQRLSSVEDAIGVLAAFPGAPGQLPRQQMSWAPGRGRQAQALPEPLTEREETVLRYLSGTLSLREIGEALFVSQNTVKTHTRAIYRKLGTSSRHGAVRRGRELGILC
jgi:LuxR family transcriptional regulator, maltose regulon positive regulatory protein